jgi:segregation and condensation protein B
MNAEEPMMENRGQAGPPPLKRIVEALLFVGGLPLTIARAAEIIRGLSPEDFQAAIEELNQEYRGYGRPYEITSKRDGFVFALRPGYEVMLKELYGGTREARLSPAALDVLAIVAYRQPISRADIDALRGARSSGVLRQLVRRGLVVMDPGEGGSRQASYRTTPRFLEIFGLASLEDLPRVQDLRVL